MFSLIVFGWMIFRAPSLAWLGHALFGSSFIKAPAEGITALIALSMAFFYALPLWVKGAVDRFSRDGWLQAAYFALASAAVLVYLGSGSADFIYFQF